VTQQLAEPVQHVHVMNILLTWAQATAGWVWTVSAAPTTSITMPGTRLA
jgi:hypothetical protein